MKITIDGHKVEVSPNATLLGAARKLGIDVPSLCFLEGCKPSTSCLVCLVKVGNSGRLVPACGTQAVEGMEVESETAEVHQARRTALELLLSDHVGDCLAPCWFACPANMDIPLMLRQIRGGNLRDAIVTVKRDIALPAVLGRICPKPCEKGCRRKAADGPVAICELKRYVADVDLASGDPYLPQCKPSTGKHVAILGGGPTGLAAAYYLARNGHAATIFEATKELGGRLRHETSEDELPRDVLDREIALITGRGVEVRVNTPVGDEPSLEALRTRFDAVLVACGAQKKQGTGPICRDGPTNLRSVPGASHKLDLPPFSRWGLKTTGRGVQVDRATFATNLEGVFAAGNAIRTKGLVIRSVADGKEAALALHQFLTGQTLRGTEKPFSSRIGRLGEEEVREFLADASQAPRRDPSAPTGFQQEEAAEQSGRCLHCDCRALDTCKLKRYAELYHADPNRYRGRRSPFRRSTQHSQVIYEPGKCIDCGLCIEIAAAAGEPLGLTFIGRGFDVRVGVPFDRPLEEALRKVAVECVAACPTAALALKRETPQSKSPIPG